MLYRTTTYNVFLIHALRHRKRRIRFYMMNQNDACQRFKSWLEFRGLASGTITQYIYWFTKFSESLPPDTDFLLLDKQLAIDYVFNFKANTKLSPSTINVISSALCDYYDVILGRPISKRCLPNIKYTQKEINVFTDSEISLLLQNSDIRLKAWIFLGFDCGFRVSEVANFKVKDIDSDNMLLHITNSKRGKSRYVKLSPRCLEVLRRYYVTYKDEITDYMFPHKTKGHIPPQYISTAFHKLLLKLSIRPDDKLRFHNLRDTFATNLWKAGCDIFLIKKVLGHSSIKSTARYISCNTNDISDMISPSDIMNGKKHE